jgi:hypothetical protein
MTDTNFNYPTFILTKRLVSLGIPKSDFWVVMAAIAGFWSNAFLLMNLTPGKYAGLELGKLFCLFTKLTLYIKFVLLIVSLFFFLPSTDINDHKLLEHKLKEAHNAAQKSTESKTRFLSNMSHGNLHIRKREIKRKL